MIQTILVVIMILSPPKDINVKERLFESGLALIDELQKLARFCGCLLSYSARTPAVAFLNASRSASLSLMTFDAITSEVTNELWCQLANQLTTQISTFLSVGHKRCLNVCVLAIKELL